MLGGILGLCWSHFENLNVSCTELMDRGIGKGICFVNFAAYMNGG
ncbi:uncharacterized protein J3R85_021225 [Psidium guajava]|nr:uncharacterized protein J3R85_021225 [Psidium guajava]